MNRYARGHHLWNDDTLSDFAEYVAHCVETVRVSGLRLEPGSRFVDMEAKTCSLVGAIAVARMGGPALRWGDAPPGSASAMMRAAGMPRAPYAHMECGFHGVATVADVPHGLEFWGLGAVFAEGLPTPDDEEPDIDTPELNAASDALHEIVSALYARLVRAQGVPPRTAAWVVLDACVRASMTAMFVCETELNEWSPGNAVGLIQEAASDIVSSVGDELLGVAEEELPETSVEAAPPGTVLQ